MEMEILQIVALLVTGIAVGFASGLLGVGGCFIMVPVQFWVLKSIGVDPTIAIRIAFGTNLLVVLPTAFSGAMTHHIKGAVLWKAGVTLGIAGAVGAFFGAFIAAHLPGRILTVAFGISVILGAIRMLTTKPPKMADEPSESLATSPYLDTNHPLLAHYMLIQNSYKIERDCKSSITRDFGDNKKSWY